MNGSASCAAAAVSEEPAAAVHAVTGRRSRKGAIGPVLRCGFVGHRDIVGSMNMHPLAFGSRIGYPTSLTYRRPGPLRNRRQAKELSPGRGPLGASPHFLLTCTF